MLKPPEQIRLHMVKAQELFNVSRLYLGNFVPAQILKELVIELELLEVVFYLLLQVVVSSVI